MKGNKSRFLNKKAFVLIGVLLLFLSAVILLWHGNATSNQAISALVAQVYFDGEIRIFEKEINSNNSAK